MRASRSCCSRSSRLSERIVVVVEEEGAIGGRDYIDGGRQVAARGWQVVKDSEIGTCALKVGRLGSFTLNEVKGVREDGR